MAALLVVVLALAGPAMGGGGANVRVTPHAGSRSSTFSVGFTAPEAAGTQGVFERTYEVSAIGPAGSRCTSAASNVVRAASRGRRVRVALAPSPRWCRGRFSGAITLLQGPHCERGQVCPEFVTRIATIGRFHFGVR